MPDTVLIVDPTTREPININASAGVVLKPTIVLDTALYAAGDVLFIPTLLAGALSSSGRITLIQSIVAIDKAAVGPTIELMFFDSNPTSFGAANAAMALSDADSVKGLGSVIIGGTDYPWVTRPNQKGCTIRNFGLEVEAASGTDIYVAGWIPTGGTVGTFAASDLFLRFGFIQG